MDNLPQHAVNACYGWFFLSKVKNEGISSIVAVQPPENIYLCIETW